jgi:hypothetical protein
LWLYAGCAGESASRNTAQTGAALVNQYKLETVDFFNAQNDLNQSITELIVLRNRDTALLVGENEQQRSIWRAQNNKGAVEIYDSLSTESSHRLLSTNIDLESLKPVTAPALIATDPKPFDDVVAGLKKLAEKPTPQERLTFLGAEGKAVYDGYQASLKDATGKAKTAATQTPKTK